MLSRDRRELSIISRQPCSLLCTCRYRRGECLLSIKGSESWNAAPDCCCLPERSDASVVSSRVWFHEVCRLSYYYLRSSVSTVDSYWSLQYIRLGTVSLSLSLVVQVLYYPRLSHRKRARNANSPKRWTEFMVSGLISKLKTRFIGDPHGTVRVASCNFVWSYWKSLRTSFRFLRSVVQRLDPWLRVVMFTELFLGTIWAAVVALTLLRLFSLHEFELFVAWREAPQPQIWARDERGGFHRPRRQFRFWRISIVVSWSKVVSR